MSPISTLESTAKLNGPGNTSSGISSDHVIIMVTVIVASINLALFVAVIVYFCTQKRSPEKEVTSGTYGKSGFCREKVVLKIFYGKLAKIFPINILHELVPAGVITTDDMDDISHIPKLKDKASFILNKIDRSLEADVKNSFYTMLDAMEECGNDDVRDIVRDIRKTLMTVLSSSCCHCDQFSYDITHHGYTIKKIPPDTDSNDNTLSTSLDQGIPLITCSCSECKLPRKVVQLLRSSSMPDRWNVLQLQQTSSNGHSTQTNEKVKVVIHSDLESSLPIDEVLEWLNSKLSPSLRVNKKMPESLV